MGDSNGLQLKSPNTTLYVCPSFFSSHRTLFETCLKNIALVAKVLFRGSGPWTAVISSSLCRGSVRFQWLTRSLGIGGSFCNICAGEKRAMATNRLGDGRILYRAFAGKCSRSRLTPNLHSMRIARSTSCSIHRCETILLKSRESPPGFLILIFQKRIVTMHPGGPGRYTDRIVPTMTNASAHS